MSDLWDWFVSTQRDSPHVFKALLAGTLVSIVCSVVGCFIILRRMSFLADALAHSMLAGVVAGYLLMKLIFGAEAHGPAMLLGAMFAGFVTVATIGLVTRFSRVKEDTAIGIIYTGIFAVGGLLASVFSGAVHIDLMHFLTGQVLAVKNADLWTMAFVAAGVLAVVILLFRELQLVSFDRVMAASIGIPVLALDYLLTACTSLVVVSGVNIVGIVLVVGLLITPAATAYLLFDRLHRMLIAAAAFGVSSFLIGYFLSTAINAAPGSAIVVTCTAQFLIVLAIAPRYGLIADWLRKRRTAPQTLIEDVLGSILRAPGARVPLAIVQKHVAGGADRIRRAVSYLERQGMLVNEGGELMLTPAGDLEARRLLRAHRLWEAYLEHVGAPVEQLHDQAHRLEHVHDEATVDYLDDKLGHPLRDPHGAEIPEDFVHLQPGAVVKASLLREGRRATVAAVERTAGDLRLQPGDAVVAGPRHADGKIWTLVRSDGEEVRLDHEAADAVTVTLGESP
jgi:manganese/iron transport system permease protein/iron/zinc/copper transport system permease protein